MEQQQPVDVEQSLADLEDRIDRLRALYDQYFCGLEKLEPQIPRKDVDRRIVILRKTQIRNTAMRFKFQTLIQRFGTMQQHWNRITREIENGTFRRDIAKAAARFGVDEALTAVGKKRAASLEKGLKAQVSRDEKRLGRKKQEAKDEYEEVDDADVVEEADDFDDDAPTPPPSRAFNSPSAVREAPVDAPPAEARPAPRAAAFDIGVAELGYDLSNEPAFASDSPGKPGEYVPPSPAAAAVPAPKKAAGGLRFGGGGGGARRADPAALSRMASLVGDGGEAPPAAPAAERAAPVTAPHSPASRPGAREPSRKPLLSGPLDIDLGDLPPEPPPKARVPDPEPAATPQPAKLGLKRPTSPSSETAAARRPEADEPAPAPAPEPKPAAQGMVELTDTRSPSGSNLRPPPRAGATNPDAGARAKPAAAEGLTDDRLREIYGEYVNARRERKESTAGITFEKLADSLRSQATKLKEKHSAKKVDYEIVLRDGKTLIKPIVR